MNVWIFNHYAISPDLPGGTRHYDMAKELIKRGYNVTIFASSFHYSIYRETRLLPTEKWKIEDIDGVKFVWIKTPSYQQNDWRRIWNMVAFMLRVWQLGRKLPEVIDEIEKPEVIIGSSVHLLAVLAAYQVAKYHKAKFIMEVRDLWPQTLIDMGALKENSLITKILRTLECFLYQRAERIITLLPWAHEYILHCGVARKKIAWIPNGVDLSRFAYVDQDVKRRYLNEFKILYLGAHGQANALDILLEAAKIIQSKGYQDILFVFIGDGPEKPRLIETARKLQLNNVKFENPVKKVEVPRVIQKADIGVFVLHDLPIYKYGISLNKLFDYLAGGKPLILVGNPINNVVKETQCGIAVPSKDPKVLAEAIINLYRMSPEERQIMGRRGRAYVEKYHSIPVLADKLEKVLQEVVQK